MKRLVVFLCLLILFAGLILFRRRQQIDIRSEVPPEDLLKVETTELQDRTFTDEVTFTGSLEAEDTAAVVCKVPGRTVLRVLVDIGDEVKKDQPLAMLDDSIIRQQLAQASATVQKAEAYFRTVGEDYKRYSRLLKEKTISRQRYDHVQGEYRVASQQLQAARAAYRQLEIQRSYHRIEAPVPGLISGRFMNPGDTSSSSSPAFMISRQKRVKATGSVPESSYPLLELGQEAQVAVDALGGRTFNARISRISPTLDPLTRTGDIEVLLLSGDILKPGMFARVRIVISKHFGKGLPMDVIRTLPGTGRSICYVASGDMVEMRMLTTGVEEENIVEVLGGVRPGERVISTLSDKLAEGVRVEVVEN